MKIFSAPACLGLSCTLDTLIVDVSRMSIEKSLPSKVICPTKLNNLSWTSVRQFPQNSPPFTDIPGVTDDLDKKNWCISHLKRSYMGLWALERSILGTL